MGATSETIAVVADGMNISISAKSRYGSNLDYRDLLTEVCQGRDLSFRPRMITSLLPNSERFLRCVARWWEVRAVPPKLFSDGRTKDRTDGYVSESIADFTESDVDTIVLLSGDCDFAPMLNRAKRKGKRVEVVGVPGTVALELVRIADQVHYIGEQHLLAA